MKLTLEISLDEEEWSLLNAAADSVYSSVEDLAKVSLVERCSNMSEDYDLCEATRVTMFERLSKALAN